MLPYSQFVFGGSLSPDAPSDMYSGMEKQPGSQRDPQPADGHHPDGKFARHQ